MDPMVVEDLKDRFFLYNSEESVFVEKAMEAYRGNKQYIFNGTCLHIFVLTNACNMCCVYCQAQVFYINRDENQRLERLDLKTKQSSVVMKDGVEKFAVLGDDIIALNLKGELYRLRWRDKEQEKLADYIQGFYVGKKLFVQNSTQIVSMSYEGKNQELLEKNAALKGYEDGKVYYISLDTKKNKSGEEYVLYEKDIDLDEDRVVKRSKTPIQNIY